MSRRQPSVLHCGNRRLDLSRPRVMGILNVTPDSFSDGGRHAGVEAALLHARRMCAEGADIIDVGGESTRPGAAPVSVQQELDRVLPVVERIVAELDVCVSVDTSTAPVMRAAAAAGAHLVNDVRALQREGALAAAAESGLPVCLMHMRGEPGDMQHAPVYRDVVAEVLEFLRGRAAAAVAAGIDGGRLLIDPGFGFGKTLAHNLALFRALDRFAAEPWPLLVGVSRKSMIGALLGNRPVEERLHGSVAAAVLAARAGAAILRVHDVGPTADALAVALALQQETDGRA